MLRLTGLYRLACSTDYSNLSMWTYAIHCLRQVEYSPIHAAMQPFYLLFFRCGQFCGLAHYLNAIGIGDHNPVAAWLCN